jgi:hypothetical protein
MSGTSVVNVANNDQRIWNRDQVVMELVQAASRGDDIVVRMNGEGPCAASLGLYDMLDLVGYDPAKILISTCNLLEAHDRYRVRPTAPDKHLGWIQETMKAGIPNKTISASTRHFGHFVGHGSLPRLAIAAHLWQHHRERSLQTYHTTIADPDHREWVALEDLLFYGFGGELLAPALDLLQHAPLTWDRKDVTPIVDRMMYGIIGAYDHVFVDVVCHTYYTGRTFYLDEKIWRPIMTRTPFMVHGPQNFIQNLKRLGFQTFGRWWDEGYSQDPTHAQITSVLHNIDMLAQKTTNQLEIMYNEMQPVLQHNFDLLLRLTHRDFFRDYT